MTSMPETADRAEWEDLAGMVRMAAMAILKALGAGSGGAGGGGGAGGHSGGGHDAFNTEGIVVVRVEMDIESNTIYNLYAGDGSTGGAAGDGGVSGDGGVGGLNVITTTYGKGGDGWAGGPGGSALPGGRGGDAFGISVDGPSTFELAIFNNDIWNVNAGLGGDGSPAGTGGNGGNGGNTLDTNYGTGGNGGPGAFGGDGSYGGDSGLASLVMIEDVIGIVYNNTLVNSIAPEVSGSGSSGGAGGTGGLGGDGATDGSDGANGSTGSSGGSNDAGLAVGVYMECGEDLQTRVFNNILYQSNSSASNTIAAVEEYCGFLEYDYNAIYGWLFDYDDMEPESHSISSDPKFVSATNHELQQDSPCIDSGNNVGAPSDDINGDPRPYDGDGVGGAVVDIGAYEASGFARFIFLPVILK